MDGNKNQTKPNQKQQRHLIVKLLIITEVVEEYLECTITFSVASGYRLEKLSHLLSNSLNPSVPPYFFC